MDEEQFDLDLREWVIISGNSYVDSSDKLDCICNVCIDNIGSAFPFKDWNQQYNELRSQLEAQALGLQNVYNKFDEIVKKMDLVLSVRNDPDTLDRLQKIIELIQ